MQRIDISQDAIGNFQFQINHCHARLRDGTLVIINPEQDVDLRRDQRIDAGVGGALKSVAADLKASLQVEPVVRVYLGVPKLKMVCLNVRSEWQENGKQRFSEMKRQILEETRGGNEQEIAVKTLNVRLLLSTDDLAGYELIPIAQVHRADEARPAPSSTFATSRHYWIAIAGHHWAKLSGRSTTLSARKSKFSQRKSSLEEFHWPAISPAMWSVC